MSKLTAPALPLTLLLAPALLSASPTADVRSCTVTPVMEEGALKALDIEMRLNGDADGKTMLLLPASNRPRMGNPLDTISDVRVSNGNISAPEPWLRELTHAPGAPLVVSYRITQKSEQRFNTIVRPNFFSAEGQRIFFGVEGRDKFQFKFKWGSLPAGWSVASDLEHENRAQTPELDLAHSFFIGGSGTGIVIEEEKLAKGRFRVALPTDAGVEPKGFAQLALRIARTANDLWQDEGTEYLVAMTTVRMPGAIVRSGFGMTDAYALYVTPDPEPVGLKALIAHEYLHTWIGKRFGEDAPFWLREGFTDYYTRLVALRADAFTPGDYVQNWNETLLRYASSPARLKTVAEVEKEAERDADADRLGYDRGSMIAALFDYRIRTSTGGKMTLTNVLRLVKKDFDNGNREGDASDRLILKARQAAKVDLQPDVDRYLNRGEELLLPQDLFGGCATVATINVPKFDRGYEVDGADKPIGGVDPKSRAYAAGLRNGMIYLKREGGKPGDSRVEWAVRVRDGDQERLIRYMPAGAEMLKVQEVQLRPASSGKAATACTRLLSGLAA